MELSDVPELEDYIALTDAARALGVSRQAMHGMIRSGKIESIRKVGPIPVYMLLKTEFNKIVEKRTPAVPS